MSPQENVIYWEKCLGEQGWKAEQKAAFLMDIWLVKIGEPLPIEENIRQMRTTMLAYELLERGHRVLWWTSAFDHFKREWIPGPDQKSTVEDGFDVLPLKGVGYKNNVSIRRFADHRIIARKFRRIARELPRPDVIVTSTPPHDTANEAVDYAKENGIPVLVDIRDPWPDLFIEYCPSCLKRLVSIALRKDFSMVRSAMRRADGLIGVNSTLLAWGLDYAGREGEWTDQVFFLGCLEGDSDPTKRTRIDDLADTLEGKFLVVFIGTFGHYNDPAILVDCARELVDSNVCFVLAGTGEFYDEIKEKAAGLPNVVLTGWLNQDEITALLSCAHVGVCTTPKARDIRLQNKAFLYLSAGLPIISAFQGDLREIIETENLGYFYPPGDRDALVGHIKTLQENPSLYSEISANAERIFNERFDANKIYKQYADHIERVAGEHGRPGSRDKSAPELDNYQKYTKRIMDLGFSACGLVLLAPLFLAIAILIKREDGGSVFYGGPRVGLGGRLIKVYKFRTMSMDVDHLVGPSTPDNDPRITEIGRLLRKYKLDELPQLINVLKGEMSLVGPRPEVQEYVALFTEEEKVILDVRPGITDWASISNYDQGAFFSQHEDTEKAYLELVRPRKLKLQKRYVERMSLRTDLGIIWKTIVTVATRKKSSGVPDDRESLSH